MGISSTGLFFYGLLWKDEEKPWKQPTPSELEKAKYGEPDWEELFEMRSGTSAKDSPVISHIHCSFDFSMHLVAIRETFVKAYRGDPQQATILSVKPEWEPQLRRFCEIMGIQWRDPAWWVTSLYG